MIRFRTLWTVEVRHAFFGAGAEVLEFLVPPATQRALAGVHALARERLGVLHVLIEVDEAGQPLAPLAGRRFVFRLRPRQAAFETVTQPFGIARGETALWANAGTLDALDVPVAAPDNDTSAWGLLALTATPGHVADGHAFHLDFAARSDTLRYYVVARAYAQAEFDQLGLQDAGFAAEARPQIVFDRLLPPAFGAEHLPLALLDPAGGARVACFQARTPVARRPRGPARLQLHRSGDVLIGHLPQPGADRPDAHFIVHLSKP